MSKEKVNKVVFTIALIGFALWLGGNVTRNAIAYDFLEIKEQIGIKQQIEMQEYWYGLYHFTNLGAYSSAGFVILFVSAITLIFANFKNLKLKGWMFMAIVCFLLAFPINCLLVYYDIKLGLAIYYENIRDVSNIAFEEFFLNRYTDVTINVLSNLSYLLCFTSAIILIWKPLDLESSK